MVHFAVILSILFSTLAVLGSTASQSQAELEESCDSPSKARVALQKSRGHKVESVLEEVPDIWSDRESATKKGNSLTQSGLATVSQKWRPKMPNIRWPWKKRPTPAPAPTPSPEDRTLLEGMRQKFMEWAINDFKSFENLLGRDEWMALGHETQTKIIESGPENVDKVLGDEFNKLSDDVKRKLKDHRRGGLLQVFSQKQALTEGRHADLMQALTEGRHTELLQVSNQNEKKFVGFFVKLFLKVDFVVEMYASILKTVGENWDEVPTFIQGIIIGKLCNEDTLDGLMQRIRESVKDEDALDAIKEMVEQDWNVICPAR